MKIACPRCGANVSFMPGTQKFYCEYCGSQINVSEFNIDGNEKENVVQSKPTELTDSPKENLTNLSSNYDEYTCSTCGAKLITDETTTVTDCVYCGSRQILKKKFKGDFNPVEIIPFKINREQFINIYTKFVKKKFWAPKEFKNTSRLMETKGIYVPFHLFFFDIDTYARGKADVYHGDEVDTEGETYYKRYFESEFSMRILVPGDSSEKFNDNFMTSLEPFDYKELIKFNPAFLNGFLAENGNENMEELERKAEARGINASKGYLNIKLRSHENKQTIGNEQSNVNGTAGFIPCCDEWDLKIIRGKWQINFKKIESRYVLLPVWFINTWYKNKLYTYAVNGQTGKVVGAIPVSSTKLKLSLIGPLIFTFVYAFFAVLLAVFVDVDFFTTLMIGSIPLMIMLFLIFVIIRGISLKKYKNLNAVQENPIQSWNIKEKKYNKYSKEQYMKIFGEEDLNKLDMQLLRNGVNVKELNKNMKKKS